MSRIRGLNDQLRKTGQGGRVLITRGVLELGEDAVRQAIEKVRTFEAFTPDNDPYGEHGVGSFEIEGRKFFWKIDYYDTNELYVSPDPADPRVTSRVLTVMLAEEYW